MAIASFALSAASQVASFKAQNAQAQAQAEAQNAQIKAWSDSNMSAAKSLADQTHQENVKMQQEQAKATAEKMQLKREAAQAKGTALASSESGGLSEEMLLANIEREQANYTDVIGQNLENAGLQSYWTKQGMVSQAQSRANSTKPTGGSVTGGSSASLGLGLIGAGVDTYNTYRVKPVKGDIKTAG